MMKELVLCEARDNNNIKGLFLLLVAYDKRLFRKITQEYIEIRSLFSTSLECLRTCLGQR